MGRFYWSVHWLQNSYSQLDRFGLPAFIRAENKQETKRSSLFLWVYRKRSDSFFYWASVYSWIHLPENEIGSFQFISWLLLLHTAASVLLCLIVYSWDKSQSRIEESWINYSENMQIRWGSDLKEPSSLKKKVWGNSPVYVSAHVCSVHTVCNSHLSILTGVDIMSLFKVALKSNFIFKALTPM